MEGNGSREHCELAAVFLFFFKKGQMEFIHISAWNPNDPLVPIENPNDRAPLLLNCSIVSHFLPTPHQSGRNRREAERKRFDAAISRAVGTRSGIDPPKKFYVTRMF